MAARSDEKCNRAKVLQITIISAAASSVYAHARPRTADNVSNNIHMSNTPQCTCCLAAVRMNGVSLRAQNLAAGFLPTCSATPLSVLATCNNGFA